MKLKLSAVVLCGAVAVVLAPACDLTYTCDTVEPGGAGAGCPTESVGAGDYLRGGDEGGGEELGSDSFELMAGCTPFHDCADMFEMPGHWWALHAQEQSWL
ncbi:MAG TPA: hypothetical protein VL242_31925 [Sorangium sp.]|nr:hypothetical protein [Sorangium sp.]